MTVSVFASGSGGNCLLLQGKTNILIDAGISMRRISAALSQRELTFQDIGGVLITHEHSDHIYALKSMMKHPGPVIYAPHTVAHRIIGMLPECEGRICVVPVGGKFFVGDLSVTAFHTPHDTDESVGYRIEEDGSCFAIATDMGRATEEVRDGLLGAECVLVESNHDEDMLKNGPYPYPLKRRILSDHGHLSNESCASLARFLAGNGTKKIILGHLSKENNRPEIAMSVSGEALEGTDTELLCAPVLGMLTVEV